MTLGVVAAGRNARAAAEIRATGTLVATVVMRSGDAGELTTPIEVWQTTDREFPVLEGDWIAAECGVTIRQAFNVAAKAGGWG